MPHTNSSQITDLIQRINTSGLNRFMSGIGNIDTKTRTVEVAFASEKAKVARFFGDEVLGHKSSEVRLGRLNDGAPLLLDHNPSDQIGIVESARIDSDGVGRAVVRFSQGVRASEIFADVQDRIRRNISVGYIVHDMRLEESGDQENDVYRVTDWEPYEISLVSVPADPSVGVGRGLSPNPIENAAAKPENTSENQPEQRQHSMPQAAKHPEPQPASPSNGSIRTLEQEQIRVRTIVATAGEYGAHDLGAQFAADPNGTVEGLQRALLERQGKSTPVPQKNSIIGMDERDLKNYSILRAVRALASPDPRVRDAAGFEFEVSQEAAKHQNGMRSDRLMIPADVLRHGIGSSGLTRDLNTGSNGQTGPGSSGGATVATTLLAGSYIETLRNRLTFARNVQLLNGLVGNVDITKQTGETKSFWLGEGDDTVSSDVDFSNLDLTPHTAGARTAITRRFLEQTSLDAEGILRRDLAKSMAQGIDYAGYYGEGGTKQPLGLANLQGINKIEFSGAFPTYGELVEMESIIASQNADVESMRYKVRPDLRGYAKSTLAFSASGSERIWEPGGTINGYECDVTNQLQKGDVFMGNFNDVIMGMWGGLEIGVDPYSGMASGSVRIVTFQDIDWQFRRDESFVLGRPAPAPTGKGS